MAGTSHLSPTVGAAKNRSRSWMRPARTSGRSPPPATTDIPHGRWDLRGSSVNSGRITVVVAGILSGVALAAPAPAAMDVFSQPLSPQQQELRTSIDAPSGRAPRLAIPAFLVAGSEAELQEHSKTLAGVLWKDLEFEREYQMIDPSLASLIPPVPPDALAYEDWMQTGADDVLV